MYINSDCRHILLSLAIVLSACGSKTQSKYSPPDTPAGKLKSIAYLPQYGENLDSITQDNISSSFESAWVGVYPQTSWIPMTKAAQRLDAAGVVGVWAAQEKTYMQTGLMAVTAIKAICDATQTDGFLQVTVFHAKAGSGSTFFLFRPLFGGGGEQAGAARVAAALYECKNYERIWQDSQETSYSGNYTQVQFIQYAMGSLAAKIPVK
jgi:hypothetical protein